MKTEILLGIGLLAGSVWAAERNRFVVAQDGSGDFKTVQAAIDAAPATATVPFMIFIKKGVYREKVFIDKPFLNLEGEDRATTQIVYPILNSKWDADFHAAHPKGGNNRWGCATVNLSSNANDITFKTLTIYNNYGATAPEKTNGHQFAIFGRGTRTIILACNVWSDGSDTLSLWNAAQGQYYHADCDFRSTGVDYVCPRGWCYVTRCAFHGHRSAQVWHDGSRDKDQKFVLTACTFESAEKDSDLGRHHADACFYLVDCTFDAGNITKPIAHVGKSKNVTWGERVYYLGCKRNNGTVPDWAKDNCPVSRETLTAKWTFAGKWDPEAELAAGKR